MIPLDDGDSSRRTVPIVTYTLIAINFLVFLLQLEQGEEFIKRWAFVPQRFSANPISEFPTVFTSMFMHGGWGHIAGNMLYLWIFGKNVEDRLGKVSYIILYFLAGIAATFAQYMFSSHSDLPNLGASGAIAGILGSYIVFFPGHKIRVLVGQSITEMPSLIVIGFWFLIQLFSEVGTLSSSQQDSGGVAYMAHVGGFILGLAFAFVFDSTRGEGS